MRLLLIENRGFSEDEVHYLNWPLFQVLPTATKLISGSERYHRQFTPNSNILVVGIPNVGKSSLINLVRSGALRIGGKPTKTGAKPGITRALQMKIRVCDDPLIYILDTPGIMMPNIRNLEIGMKLAACGKNDKQFHNFIEKNIIALLFLFCSNVKGRASWYHQYRRLYPLSTQQKPGV